MDEAGGRSQPRWSSPGYASSSALLCPELAGRLSSREVWTYEARVVHTDASVTPRRIVVSSLVYEFALIIGTGAALGLALWTWAAAGAVMGVPVLIAAILAVIVGLSRLHQLNALVLRFLARAIPERWRNAAEEMQQAADDPGLGLKAAALFTGGYLLTNFLLSVAFVLIVRRPAPLVVTMPGTGYRLLGGPLSKGATPGDEEVPGVVRPLTHWGRSLCIPNFILITGTGSDRDLIWPWPQGQVRRQRAGGAQGLARSGTEKDAPQ